MDRTISIQMTVTAEKDENGKWDTRKVVAVQIEVIDKELIKDQQATVRKVTSSDGEVVSYGVGLNGITLWANVSIRDAFDYFGVLLHALGHDYRKDIAANNDEQPKEQSAE